MLCLIVITLLKGQFQLRWVVVFVATLSICISVSGGGVGRVEIFHYTHNNNNTEDHYSHIDTALNLPIQLWGGRGRHTLYVLILSILALSFSKCVLSLLHQLISPRDTPRPVRTFVKGTRHTQYTSKVHS